MTICIHIANTKFVHKSINFLQIDFVIEQNINVYECILLYKNITLWVNFQWFYMRIITYIYIYIYIYIYEILSDIIPKHLLQISKNTVLTVWGLNLGVHTS